MAAIGKNWADIWGPVWGDVWAQSEALVVVPDVVGQSQASGTAELQGEGFVVAVSTAPSDSVDLGNIISQLPLAAAEAASGSTVTITVSSGEGGAFKIMRHFSSRLRAAQ